LILKNTADHDQDGAGQICFRQKLREISNMCSDAHLILARRPGDGDGRRLRVQSAL
jgi:hypothetical protein